MIRIDADFDYTNALIEGWNRKLRSVRIASFIISILLVVCALLYQTLPRSAGKYISSFIGFAPADDPQILGMVIIQ